ncbi:MAG: hypothetical protein IPM29_10115 [Planctomycetes bacterium]|nr:hypothetical protein [Planctomycetota bacterium]
MIARRVCALLAVGLCAAVLVGCRCLSCHRGLDVLIVTQPPGGDLTLLDPGGVARPPVIEPLRVRRAFERLSPLPGLSGDAERGAELAVRFDRRTARGRICVELRDALTGDRLDVVEQVFVTRCETDDGGALWFDGELVRAAAPLDGALWLVTHVARPGGVTVDGRALLGPRTAWRGAAERLAPDAWSEVRAAGATVRVRGAAGACVQIALDPRLAPDLLELSLGSALSGHWHDDGAAPRPLGAERLRLAGVTAGRLVVCAASAPDVPLAELQLERDLTATDQALRVRVSFTPPRPAEPPRAGTTPPSPAPGAPR